MTSLRSSRFALLLAGWRIQPYLSGHSLVEAHGRVGGVRSSCGWGKIWCALRSLLFTWPGALAWRFPSLPLSAPSPSSSPSSPLLPLGYRTNLVETPSPLRPDAQLKNTPAISMTPPPLTFDPGAVSNSGPVDMGLLVECTHLHGGEGRQVAVM